MKEQAVNFRFLSGNILKIIAALAMLIDHVGLFFFPFNIGFRIVGRLAFPIFAYMIAIGTRYTRNKLRYFLNVFTVATVCQIAYFISMKSLYMSILVTFSLSILIIYSFQYLKLVFIKSDTKTHQQLLAVFLFILAVGAAIAVNLCFDVDYGLSGCFVPVFASAFHMPIEASDKLKRLDNHYVHIAATTLGLIILAIDVGTIQFFSLFSIPLLLAYSGKRGKARMKYFFYIFYPAHLLVLEGLYILLR